MQENCFLYNKCNHVHCNDSFCMRRYKMERIYANSLVPAKYQANTELFIDKDGTDYAEFIQLQGIAKDIEGFVGRGENLYICSEICGNGKTSWATKLLWCYANRIWPSASDGCKVLFIYVPDFILNIKANISSYNEEANFILDNYLNADIVVWDDLATKAASQFELDHLLRMINDRVSAGKTNIYTSNKDIDSLSAIFDERLASRVRMSTVIKLKGKDKRMLAVKEDK